MTIVWCAFASILLSICFCTSASADSYFLADADGIEQLWKGFALNDIDVLDLTADLNPKSEEADKSDRKVMLESFKILPVVRIDRGDTAIYVNPDNVSLPDRRGMTILRHRDRIRSLVFELIKSWHEYQRLKISESQDIDDILKTKNLQHKLMVKCGATYLEKAESCMSRYSPEELSAIKTALPGTFPVKRKTGTRYRPQEQILLEPNTFQAPPNP